MVNVVTRPLLNALYGSLQLRLWPRISELQIHGVYPGYTAGYIFMLPLSMKNKFSM